MFTKLPHTYRNRAVYLRDDGPASLGGPFAFSLDREWGPVLRRDGWTTESWHDAALFPTELAALSWLDRMGGHKRTYEEVKAMDLEDWR